MIAVGLYHFVNVHLESKHKKARLDFLHATTETPLIEIVSMIFSFDVEFSASSLEIIVSFDGSEIESKQHDTNVVECFRCKYILVHPRNRVFLQMLQDF